MVGLAVSVCLAPHADEVNSAARTFCNVASALSDVSASTVLTMYVVVATCSAGALRSLCTAASALADSTSAS